jgi:hypothetical protein
MTRQLGGSRRCPARTKTAPLIWSAWTITPLARHPRGARRCGTAPPILSIHFWRPVLTEIYLCNFCSCQKYSVATAAPRTVHSIYARDHDQAWLAKMYPLLKSYLNFWLTNRTDAGGYQICMCTWESGQDMMKRWGWNQKYGGDRSSRAIRAPEHQAAMAHAAGCMVSFAQSLKLPPEEKQYWDTIRDRHVALTMTLYNASAGWFCDYNSQTQSWQSGCADVGPASGNTGAGKQTYQLAPLFFHSPALGVNLLAGVDKSALIGMVDTVTSPMKFGSDPPGSLTFAQYCTMTPPDPRCVSPPEHNYHDQKSGLTEIYDYLRFWID